MNWHCDHNAWKEERRYKVWASNRSEEDCPPSVPITVVEKCGICGVERHRYEAPPGACLLVMETGHPIDYTQHAGLLDELAKLAIDSNLTLVNRRRPV